MPHIIVEYPEESLDHDKIQQMLQAIHRSTTNSGLFDENFIKTRAYPFNDFTNGGGDTPYIHIQVRILSGRSADNKKSLSEAILADLKPLGIRDSIITVEIVDMDRDSYGKLIPM